MKCSHAACRCTIGEEAQPVEREGRTFCSDACARLDRSSSGIDGECGCQHPECTEGPQVESPGLL